jgi:hypothetical protein
MSSFLDRLIERAQGSARVTEPLVPSHFAPSPWQIVGSAQDFREESLLEEGPDTRHASPAPSVRSPAPPREPAESARVRDDGETGTTPLESPLLVDQVSDRESLALPKGTFERTEEFAEKPVRPVVHRTQQRLLPMPSLMEPQETDGSDLYGSDPHAATPDSSEPRTSDYGEEGQVKPYPPESASLNTETEPAIRAGLSDHPAPVDLGTLRAQISQEFEADPLEGHHRTQPSTPDPTVQVTIGRVEVRAVTPPAQPQPGLTTRPRKPALSLDDYLRRRKEGRR